MQCKACKKRGQTWRGDPPRCAFENGYFSKDNWNCATANEIRDLCESGKVYCEDDWYCILHVHPVFDDSRAALWVQWYKSRGRTTDMRLMRTDGDDPRHPTLEECEMILKRLSVTE
jgi:hypothetical protein